MTQWRCQSECEWLPVSICALHWLPTSLSPQVNWDSLQHPCWVTADVWTAMAASVWNTNYSSHLYRIYDELLPSATCKCTYFYIPNGRVHVLCWNIRKCTGPNPTAASCLGRVDTYAIDFPVAARSISCQKHWLGLQSPHVDTERNHLCLHALLMWRKKKTDKDQGITQGRMTLFWFPINRTCSLETLKDATHYNSNRFKVGLNRIVKKKSNIRFGCCILKY